MTTISQLYPQYMYHRHFNITASTISLEILMYHFSFLPEPKEIERTIYANDSERNASFNYAVSNEISMPDQLDPLPFPHS